MTELVKMVMDSYKKDSKKTLTQVFFMKKAGSISEEEYNEIKAEMKKFDDAKEAERRARIRVEIMKDMQRINMAMMEAQMDAIRRRQQEEIQAEMNSCF